MSLKTFLQRIWESISHLFGGLLEIEKKAVHIGVQVVDAIKNFDTNNPIVADILTSIIPGTLDDDIKNKLREALPKIVIELRLVDAASGLTDPNEIMLAAVKVIQQLSGDYRSSFLNELSIIASEVASDGKLTWDDAAYILKWYYDHEYQKNNNPTENGSHSS